MRPSAGCEKDTHHRASRRDTQKNANRPSEPSHFLERLAGPRIPIGPSHGKQEDTIKKQHSGTFHPSPKSGYAHGISSHPNHSSQWKKQPLPQPTLCAKKDQGSHQNKRGCRNNMGKRQSSVGGKRRVQCGHSCWASLRRVRQGNEPSQSYRDRDHNTGPEAGLEPQRRPAPYPGLLAAVDLRFPSLMF